MSKGMQATPGGMRLRLPATSANLGAGFDAAAVAFDFYLEIEAEAAAEFSIAATGRNSEYVARLENNLILEIYKGLLEPNGRPVTPLGIRMSNEIPLGMGCGSSAAGRLAAIALAVHFGELGWSSERILEEATALEGHPDNVSACWLGGFVAAVCEGRRVHVARVTPPAEWRAIVVLPAEPLATSKARAMLPECYPRTDVVAIFSRPRCWVWLLRRGAATCCALRCRTAFTSLIARRFARCCCRCCRWPASTEFWARR